MANSGALIIGLVAGVIVVLGVLAIDKRIDDPVVQALAVVFTFVTVFVLSWVTLRAIKATIGLRVAVEHEVAGLDISEHGMYGYPEQFIPAAELVGYAGGRT
jgi:ammonia channel protein AmtB